MKHEPIPQTEVLAWLATNHPALESELDRAWVWITSDLAPRHRKCECAECLAIKTVRDSLKAYGFAFAFKAHVLPSGTGARWGHSCQRPTKFIRRGKTSPAGSGEAKEVSDAELLELLA